jgi:hypothetical protein
MGADPLYRLLAWLSPAYPIGAFSYSHGVKAPFDPEGGAYGQHNHDLGHRHGPLHEDRHG